MSGLGSPSSLSSAGRLLGDRAGGRGCYLQLLLVKEREVMNEKERMMRQFANLNCVLFGAELVEHFDISLVGSGAPESSRGTLLQIFDINLH